MAMVEDAMALAHDRKLARWRERRGIHEEIAAPGLGRPARDIVLADERAERGNC
jgi:hypothetical protein